MFVSPNIKSGFQMPEKLTEQKCVPCKGGDLPMPLEEAKAYIKQVSGWTFGKTGRNQDMISKEFKFKDFKQALGFVNLVGEIAESEGHHPNIYLHSWNRVRLELYTHAIGGLSRNDFIVAAKVDERAPA